MIKKICCLIILTLSLLACNPVKKILEGEGIKEDQPISEKEIYPQGLELLEKELYAYNIANGNSQNNLVIIPSEENRHLDTLAHGPFRLEILCMDLRAIYKDFKGGSWDCLAFAHTIINH